MCKTHKLFQLLLCLSVCVHALAGFDELFQVQRDKQRAHKNETVRGMRPCEAPCLKERDVIGLVNLSNSQMRHKQIKKKKKKNKTPFSRLAAAPSPVETNPSVLPLDSGC